jgi:hypothetical protein
LARFLLVPTLRVGTQVRPLRGESVEHETTHRRCCTDPERRDAHSHAEGGNELRILFRAFLVFPLCFFHNEDILPSTIKFTRTDRAGCKGEWTVDGARGAAGLTADERNENNWFKDVPEEDVIDDQSR